MSDQRLRAGDLVQLCGTDSIYLSWICRLMSDEELAEYNRGVMLSIGPSSYFKPEDAMLSLKWTHPDVRVFRESEQHFGTIVRSVCKIPPHLAREFSLAQLTKSISNPGRFCKILLFHDGYEYFLPRQNVHKVSGV